MRAVWNSLRSYHPFKIGKPLGHVPRPDHRIGIGDRVGSAITFPNRLGHLPHTQEHSELVDENVALPRRGQHAQDGHAKAKEISQISIRKPTCLAAIKTSEGFFFSLFENTKNTPQRYFTKLRFLTKCWLLTGRAVWGGSSAISVAANLAMALRLWQAS